VRPSPSALAWWRDVTPPMRVVLAGAGAAPDSHAELWLGDELMAIAFLYDGRMHLRIVSPPDSKPWLVDATSLALALETAERQIPEQ
jgi:hypothetical protein